MVSSPSFATPAAVQNFVVEYGGAGRFSLSWDAVTESVSAGLFIPSRVRYTVKCGSTVVAENIATTSTEYTYELNESAVQAPVSFSITAMAAGKVSAATNSGTFIVGDAYTGEFAESFAKRVFSTSPWTPEINTATWAASIGSSYSPVVNPQDNDEGLLTTNNSYEARIVSPLINMAGQVNPILKFYMWHENGYYYEDAQVAFGYRVGDVDTEKGVLHTATAGESGWVEHSFEVPAEVAASDFQFYFYTPGSYGRVWIDNITIKSYRDHSLALAGLSVPETAEIGCEITLVANLLNKGINAAEGYSVTFSVDGEEIATVEGRPIAAQAEGCVELPFTVAPRFAGRSVGFSAVLNYEDDEVADDNEASADVFVNENDLAAVEFFGAEFDDTESGVIISWVPPIIDSAPTVSLVYEGFEDYEIGAKEGQNGWTFTGTDGSRKRYIGGGYSSDVYDAMVVGQYESSWDLNFYPRTGSNAVAFGKSDSYPAVETNSWIISPDAAPGSEVSFYVCGYHSYSSARDNINLLWSDGSTDPADFSEVATFSVSTGTWAECRAVLPSGAHRFAINFKGNMNNESIAIDDVTYSSYAAPAVHTGYRVYRNHAPVATLDADATEHFDADVETGLNSYYVTVLYDKGESMPSPTAVVEKTLNVGDDIVAGAPRIYVEGRCLTVVGADGCDVVVTDLSGRVVAAARGDVRVELPAGVYVASVAGIPSKVSVR